MSIDAINQAGEIIVHALLRSIPLLLAIIIALVITFLFMYWMLTIFFHLSGDRRNRNKGSGVMHKGNTLAGYRMQHDIKKNKKWNSNGNEW